LITYGQDRQLVYYWFQQRGRVITNEYLVKWYLFWDSLTRNRSDGALVRLTVRVAEGEDVAEADRELADFARTTAPLLCAYIPR
jgi:EpsI family protein